MACLSIATAWAVTADMSVMGNEYDAMRSAAVNKCYAIDPSAHQSGLFFNPDGYRSYYERSRCLQNAAEMFRDETLCHDVKRRWSLFSSSWGISRRRCKELAQQGLAKDVLAIESLKRTYAEEHVRLVDFSILRNGNDRDFDIVPIFDGRDSHAYTLIFDLVIPNRAPVLLHSSGFHLTGSSDRIRIYVPRAEIRKHLPEFSEHERYRVRARLEYSIGSGHANARWSERFINDGFPLTDRSQSVEKTVRFGDLTYVPIDLSNPAAN